MLIKGRNKKDNMHELEVFKIKREIRFFLTKHFKKYSIKFIHYLLARITEKYNVALDKRNYKSMEIARKRDPRQGSGHNLSGALNKIPLKR